MGRPAGPFNFGGNIPTGAEAMINGFIPANAGLENPFTDDNYFNLLTEPKEEKYKRLFKTSFGFGGRSAAVSIVDEREV